MTSEIQTLLALLAVGIAAVWLVRRAFRKTATGCGGDCGAVSPEMKKLQRRLRH
jgi:hypothetical protein